MSPAADPIVLARRSGSSNNVTVVLVPAIVGGLGLMAIAFAAWIFFLARRRRRIVQPEKSRFDGEHTASAASESLLHPRDYWSEAESGYTGPHGYTWPGSFQPQHEQNHSTAKPVVDEKLTVPHIPVPSIATVPVLPDPQRRSIFPPAIPPPASHATVSSAIPESPYDQPQHEQNHSTAKPVVDEKFSVPIPFPSIATVPVLTDMPDPRRRSLSPLAIPPPAPYAAVPSTIPESPNASPPISARSDGSMYSQASASLSRQNTSIIPPFIRRLTQLRHRQDEEAATEQVDIKTIGKLLKERAKRNPNKVSRDVSLIERADSIKPTSSWDEDDSGDDGARPLRHVRSKRLRVKRKLTSLVAVTEGSDTGASPPSSSRAPVTTEREWHAADIGIPALPPPTHSAAASAQNQVSSQRPQSFPVSLMMPQNQTMALHKPRRSLDAQTQTHWQSVPPSLRAGRAPPMGHVRQESAHNTIDPMGRVIPAPEPTGHFEH